MRQRWISSTCINLLTIMLLASLLITVECKKTWTKAEKEDWMKNKKEEKESEEAAEGRLPIYYASIGVGSLSLIINVVLFILAWRGIIFKKKQAEINRTLDVL